MTLKEAIEHAEEQAIRNEKEAERKREYGGEFYDSEVKACLTCAEQHRQLAEWLRELAERRKQPKQKTGEWVQVPRFEGDTQPDLECPFCKHKVGWWDMARYCAGCGAKLEGGADVQ